MTTTPAADVTRRGAATTLNELDAAKAELEARMEFLGTGGRPYVEEEVPVRASLRELAKRLRALSERSGGELAAAAREVWLDSLLPMRDPADLIRALAHVEAVCQFVDNWTDCARPQARSDAMAKADQRERELRTALGVVVGDELAAVDARAREPVASALRILLDGAQEKEAVEHDVFFDDFVNPAWVAASETLQALCALVDVLRDRAPEVLR